MFRYALVAKMLVLSFMGPNPCCCTFGRIVAATMSCARTGENKSVNGLGCCQRQLSDKSEERNALEWGRGLPASKGPTERCKCEKSLCSAVPSQSTNFTIELKRSWLDHLTLHFGSELPLEVGDCVAISAHLSGTPPAARSGRDTRVAFHSWQC